MSVVDPARSPPLPAVHTDSSEIQLADGSRIHATGGPAFSDIGAQEAGAEEAAADANNGPTLRKPKAVSLDADDPRVPERDNGGLSSPPYQPWGRNPMMTPSPYPGEKGKSLNITVYNGPKDALLAVVKAGMAKSILPSWQIILLAFNAGLFLAFGNLAAIWLAGGFSAPTIVRDANGNLLQTVTGTNDAMARLMHGAIFPIGLVLIVLAGSELFTGNVMYLTTAYASGKCRGIDMARSLFICWFANLAGSCFAAYFLTYLPELLHKGPQLSYLLSVANKKMSVGWGMTFLKGVGCNWMVCLALYCNLTAKDVVSKILAIWMPIATFVWIGFEHSIANMYLLPIAAMEGVPGKHFGDVLAWNLIPCTLGNIVGGAAFALGQWLIYGEYAAPKIEVLTTKQHIRRGRPSQTRSRGPSRSATPMHDRV